MISFPSDNSIKKLRELKIDYVIVHEDEYDRLSKDNFMVRGNKIQTEVPKKLEKNHSVKLFKKLNRSYIYKI